MLMLALTIPSTPPTSRAYQSHWRQKLVKNWLKVARPRIAMHEDGFCESDSSSNPNSPYAKTFTERSIILISV